MTPVQFSYEILSVDSAAKCMTVLYTADNKNPVTVGVRIPYEAEKLEDVILSFCPLAYWENQDKTLKVVEQGVKGTLNSVTASVTNSTDQNIADVEFFSNISGGIPSEEIK